VTEVRLVRIGAASRIPDLDAIPEPPEDGDAATVLDVVGAALTRSARALVDSDTGVRAGNDPDAVHDARVAVRRIRSDLRTFRPVLDRDWADTIRQEARWLASLLGDVRDVEVLQERLRDRLDAIDDPSDAGAGLLVDLEARRARARRRLLDGLASDRYVALLWAAVEAGREPRGRGRRAVRPADRAPALLERPWRRVKASAEHAETDPTDEALHRVRIDAKRLRYGAEALAPVAGRWARRVGKRAERLQDVLGEHQDAVTTVRWLTIRADRAKTPEVAFVAGRIVQLEVEARDDARDRWPAAWAALRRGKRPWR
jgi:CHAD domain-containing protein